MKSIKEFYKTPAACLLFLALTFISGCDSMDDLMKEEVDEDSKPKTVMTINMLVEYPRATMVEREIITFSGRKVWINTNPFLHSKYIQEIELTPSGDKPGYFDLLLKLDSTGKNMWVALVEESKINRFGVIIDGIFYRTCDPVRMKSDDDNDEWVTLKGPYDQKTAEKLKKHAKKNYEILNDK